MDTQMQHTQASDEHLRTWNRVTKLFTVSAIGIFILLSVMAATLL